MNVFEDIFQKLNKAKVKYLVAGGVAVNLHGYPRFTGDLDILVLLDDKNIEKLDSVMKEMKYSERLPVPIDILKDNKKVKQLLKEKGLMAYTFNPPKGSLLQIDIIIDESLKFEEMAARKIVKRIDGVSIPVVAIEDLIKMKKKSNRNQDVSDVSALSKLKSL